MLCQKFRFLSQIRRFHKINAVNLVGENQKAHLEVTLSNEAVKIPLVWLRDHCRSDSCYNWQTNQRKSKVLDLFAKSQVKNRNDIIFDKNRQVLEINWEDGHKSEFKASDLVRWTESSKTVPFTFWNKETLTEIPTVQMADFDFKKFCLFFAKYGVVCVDGVEKTVEATRNLCQMIAPIHNTFFGDFWVFGTDETVKEEREDTAYGTEEIGPHTDGTYLNQTPGIQVFQCLRPADKGGDTLLVDGFAVAEDFRRAFPDHFQVLSSLPVEHHYLEGINRDGTFTAEENTNQLRSRAMYHPVIRLHQNNIIQIRFNPYDRAPLPIPSDSDITKIIAFYEAYEAFSQFIHKPENAVQISLQPGTVIFVDNYRILHARTAFQGPRKMCGCYLSRDNFLAKARTVLPQEFINI
uniref:Trimethyllysine dioxygenase, mitochondrial n=1 Tax=Panagrolaimus sp. JU765 TaxID=591449 RepID=A0AC34QG30_9BILA